MLRRKRKLADKSSEQTNKSSEPKKKKQKREEEKKEQKSEEPVSSSDYDTNTESDTEGEAESKLMTLARIASILSTTQQQQQNVPEIQSFQNPSQQPPPLKTPGEILASQHLSPPISPQTNDLRQTVGEPPKIIHKNDFERYMGPQRPSFELGKNQSDIVNAFVKTLPEEELATKFTPTSNQPPQPTAPQPQNLSASWLLTSLQNSIYKLFFDSKPLVTRNIMDDIEEIYDELRDNDLISKIAKKLEYDSFSKKLVSCMAKMANILGIDKDWKKLSREERIAFLKEGIPKLIDEKKLTLLRVKDFIIDEKLRLYTTTTINPQSSNQPPQPNVPQQQDPSSPPKIVTTTTTSTNGQQATPINPQSNSPQPQISTAPQQQDLSPSRTPIVTNGQHSNFGNRFNTFQQPKRAAKKPDITTSSTSSSTTEPSNKP